MSLIELLYPHVWSELIQGLLGSIVGSVFVPAAVFIAGAGWNLLTDPLVGAEVDSLLSPASQHHSSAKRTVDHAFGDDSPSTDAVPSPAPTSAKLQPVRSLPRLVSLPTGSRPLRHPPSRASYSL